VITGFMAAFPRARAVMFHNDSRCLRNEICRTWPPTAKKSDTRHKIGKSWNQSAQQTQPRPSNPMLLVQPNNWRHRQRHQLRVQPLCELGLKEGRTTAATSVDHAKPHRGGYMKFRLGKLQSLCASCHSGAKRMEEVRGHSDAIGIEHMPIDPRHPIYRYK
jgi:5-methylcytosine-specific restriction enzyme A